LDVLGEATATLTDLAVVLEGVAGGGFQNLPLVQMGSFSTKIPPFISFAKKREKGTPL
jgi:hypothetical protein